jgi:hypothetical protein
MSDEFDVILDRCMADLASRRETLESCLQRYPAYAGQLRLLLPLAQQVQAGPAPAPLPLDKRRALESQLVRAAAKQRPPVNRPAVVHKPLWRRSGVVAALSLVVCLLLLTSTVSVSASSLPGDALYPVKRAAEQVRVALTPDVYQSDVHLDLAQVRLQELTTLAERGDVSTELMAEMDAEVDVILQRVAQRPVEEQTALLIRINSFQDEQAQALTKVAALARGDEQSKAHDALSVFAAKRDQVKGLLLKASRPVTGATPDKGKAIQPTKAQDKSHPSQGNGATVKATAKPTATDRPAVGADPTKKPAQQEGPKPTKTPRDKPDKPTPQSGNGNQGQGNPNPGQGNPNSGSQPDHPPKGPKK